MLEYNGFEVAEALKNRPGVAAINPDRILEVSGMNQKNYRGQEMTVIMFMIGHLEIDTNRIVDDNGNPITENDIYQDLSKYKKISVKSISKAINNLVERDAIRYYNESWHLNPDIAFRES